MSHLAPGAVSVSHASRQFRVVHEKNATLKELALRRRRTVSQTFTALRDVSVEIAPGDSVGIVGRNGSGKSTLLKLIAGIIEPSEGSVRTAGSIASMLELGAGFHPDFSGRENLYLNAAILGFSEKEVDHLFDDIVQFAEIADFIDAPVRTYSTGMQMRLAFSVASHVRADIMLLDEVFAVGDEAFQRKCVGRMLEYRRRGGTLVFVSHDPAAVERICDRALLLERGRVIAEGPSSEVMRDYHRLLADTNVRPQGDAVVETPEQEDEGEKEEDETRKRWGSQVVRVTGLQIINPRGEAIESIRSGDPLTIEISFTTTKETAPPLFSVDIRSEEGALCYGTSTLKEKVVVRGDFHTGTLWLNMDPCDLNAGNFDVTVSCTDEDGTEIYDVLDRWLSFTVFPAGTAAGLIDLHGRWDYAPLHSTAQ